jgi:hypothetical protein
MSVNELASPHTPEESTPLQTTAEDTTQQEPDGPELPTIEEELEGDKPIFKDGKLATFKNLPGGTVIRSKDGGCFTVKAGFWGKYLVACDDPDGWDISEVEDDFLLPDNFLRIPAELWAAVLDLYFAAKDELITGHKTEVQVILMRQSDPPHEWKIIVPTQKVSAGGIAADKEKPCYDILTGEEYPSVLEVPGYDVAGTSHSHHTMGTYFSSVDDGNELGKPGLHIVVGDMSHKKDEKKCKIRASITQMKTRYIMNSFKDVIDWKDIQVPLLLTKAKKFISHSWQMKSEFGGSGGGATYYGGYEGTFGHEGWHINSRPGNLHRSPTPPNQTTKVGPGADGPTRNNWWGFRGDAARFRRASNGLFLPVSEIGETDTGTPWDHSQEKGGGEASTDANPVGFRSTTSGSPGTPSRSTMGSSPSGQETQVGQQNSQVSNRAVETAKEILKRVTDTSEFRFLQSKKKRRLSALRDMLVAVFMEEDEQELLWTERLLKSLGYRFLGDEEREILEEIRKL